MAAQQQLFRSPDGAGRDRAPAVPASRAAKEPDLAPVWLQRASLAVLVLFCFYIGALLAALPWLPRYWDANGWLLMHPSLGVVLNRGWVRGLVSGLGLLDIWIGVSELVHYREYKA